MSRSLLTDAEQQRVTPQTGVQGVSVLAATGGGLFLRIEKITGEVTAELLSREAAEALVEQMTATLRCAPLDPHAEAVARLEAWKARRAGRTCADCDDSDLPCICQIAERPHLMTRADQPAETLSGRR